MKYAVFLWVLLFLPFPHVAVAQESSTSTDFENLPIPSWGKEIIDSFSRPLHPVIGGVASGGGAGFGVGYDSPEDDRWYREAEAIVTIRRYWSLEGEIGRRSLSKRAQIGVFGAVRHMSRLDFYGIGPNSVFEDRSAFRLRETTFGARGWLHPAPVVRIGGNAAIYIPNLGKDANRAVPSIQEVFSTESVPGFAVEPTFGRYRGFVEFLHGAPTKSEADEPHQYGATYQVAAEAVLDHDAGRHSFQRWELEVQQRIPGLKPGQRLTLHGLVASTVSDAEVPFYMLYTLGGSGALKAFRPDLLGTDGTRSTLRSFRNFRFRDRDLLLLQAEYRIPIMKTVHATVFVDAGQVAPRRSELFKDLRTGTGFSLNYMRKGKTLGRVDVGFAGGEGIRVFWTFGGF